MARCRTTSSASWWPARLAFGVVETCASNDAGRPPGPASWLCTTMCTSRDGDGSRRRIAERAILIGQAFTAACGRCAGTGAPRRGRAVLQRDAPPDEAVREGTPEDFERVIAAFAAAARRLESAGVDGVELHGPRIPALAVPGAELNRRTDEWGGSLEHRLDPAHDAGDARR